MNEENNIINACIDIPDERDYIYPETAWNIELPEEFIIDDINDYQNQWLEIITKMMCVFYSTTHGCNILNNLENVWEWDLSWKELWLKALELWRLDLKYWAAIQNWPKTARDELNIKGWFLVNQNSIKQAIFDWHPVVVGSNSLDWSKTTLESKSTTWHAILIIGWNKTWFIIKESYWKLKRDNGKQYLPYNLFNNLFISKYALIDTENILITYRKNIMEWINIEKAKEAFTLGIWNGLNPTKPASREETATMILRAIEKFKDWLI